jgi:hypothetical protein
MTQFSMAILACQKESQFAQRYQVRRYRFGHCEEQFLP